jgi:hypothetical protein
MFAPFGVGVRNPVAVPPLSLDDRGRNGEFWSSNLTIAPQRTMEANSTALMAGSEALEVISAPSFFPPFSSAWERPGAKGVES